MVERFLEQHPAICAIDIATLTEADISNAEDLITALKPIKDATTLFSQEKTHTVSLIAPVHAKLIQNKRPSAEDLPLVREIKQAISEDLIKRYSSEQERNTFHTASARDPRFKALSFLSEREKEETYGSLIAEAASLEQEVEVKGDTHHDHNKASSATSEEEPNQSPAAKRMASSSSLLENLLGPAFSDQKYSGRK
ncbi:E3 SUMO-protein ligase ZBED1-like [Vanacampus margaritifer]